MATVITLILALNSERYVDVGMCPMMKVTGIDLNYTEAAGPSQARRGARLTTKARHESSNDWKTTTTLALCNFVRDPVRETPAFFLRNIIVKIKS